MVTKFRQSSILTKKSSYLSEQLKTLTTSNYHRVQYLLLKFCITLFLLNDVYKSVSWIFLFCLDLELLITNMKNVKNIPPDKNEGTLYFC